MKTAISPKENPMRFTDPRLTLDAFRDEVLVRCPRCNACATVRLADPTRTDLFAPRRFSCLACGATKDWAGKEIGSSGESPVDDFFHYPLWLQIPCCGHTLWAYNLRHLDFLEAFVAAKLRERQPDEQAGWSNRSLFSRLPRWMRSRKNREVILKSIEKLRQSIPN